MGTTYMVTGTISTSALVVVMFAFADGQSPPKTTTPSDADIRQILVDRIDLQHQSVGIVVGVIGPAGRRVMPMGIWRRTIHVRSTATRYSKLARQRRCSWHCCWPTWRSAAKSRCAILWLSICRPAQKCLSGTG